MIFAAFRSLSGTLQTAVLVAVAAGVVFGGMQVTKHIEIRRAERAAEERTVQRIKELNNAVAQDAGLARAAANVCNSTPGFMWYSADSECRPNP